MENGTKNCLELSGLPQYTSERSEPREQTIHKFHLGSVLARTAQLQVRPNYK